MTIAILVMLFIKDDLLEKLIDKLKAVERINDVHIVFYQDNIVRSKFFNNQKYFINFINCQNIARNRVYEFSSAEYVCNNINKGVYQTYYEAMTYCFNNYDYVVFMEDDIMVQKNFLNFFMYFIDNNLLGLNENQYQLIGGESIFFQSHSSDFTFSKEKKDLLSSYIINNNITNGYHLVNWYPSSCSVMSKKVWESLKEIKSKPQTDHLIDSIFKQKKFKVVLPIIPVCEDIGMLHDKGYSVAIHKKENVQEIKNGILFEDLASCYEFKLFENITSHYSEIRTIINS
jgi:hypothetical protein